MNSNPYYYDSFIITYARMYIMRIGTLADPILLCNNSVYISIAAAISDECLPLPITPVLVGHDHEWLSVSPLSLPAWVSQI